MLTSSFYVRHGKRWFDGFAAAGGLVLLSPLLLLAAISVKLDSRGSAFFLQTRVGQAEKPFQIIKFRTMRSATHSTDPLITASGDSRITQVGRWLRQTKIDELPQLWNVLRGEMSLVGPRPEVPKYTALYSRAQKQVFTVRPGITGPAAIACVNEEELLAGQKDPESYYVNALLPAKLEIDLAYCRSMSFRNDALFIFGTFGKLAGVRRAPEDWVKVPPDRAVDPW